MRRDGERRRFGCSMTKNSRVFRRLARAGLRDGRTTGGSGARARVPLVVVDGVALALLVRSALLLGLALVPALLLAFACLPVARGGAAGRRVGIAARVGGGAPHRGRRWTRRSFAPWGSRGGVVGRPSAIAAREMRESPRRGVRTPGGRFATRARACEKRRVEGPWSWSRGARIPRCGRGDLGSIPSGAERMKRMASSRLNWRARFDQGASVPRATGRRCGGARVAGWSWRSSLRRSFSSPAPRKVRDPSATVPPRPSPGGHPPSVIRP